MRVRVHPTRPEAITKHGGTIARWSLTDPPTVLASVDDGYDKAWSPFAVQEDLAVAPDGGVFAALTPVPWDEVPYEERRGIIEVRSWDTLEVVQRITVPVSRETLSELAFSPDGRWIVAANSALYLLDRASGETADVITSVGKPVYAVSGGSVAGEQVIVMNNSMFASGLCFDSSSTRLAVGWGGQAGGRLSIYRLENGYVMPFHQELDRNDIAWDWPPGMDLADLQATSAFSWDWEIGGFLCGLSMGHGDG